MPYYTNQNQSSNTGNPNKALWRHVFFIERMMQVIALKAFGTPEAFRQAFFQHANRGDIEMLVNNCPLLSDEQTRQQAEQSALPFR